MRIIYGGPVSLLCECDCSRLRAHDAEACSRCQYLDGDETQRGRILAALRGTDGLNLRELCEELGLKPGNSNGQRQIRRPLYQLMEARRIRRYWRDNDLVAVPRSLFGRRDTITAMAGGEGCWAYVLDGKTEREWRQ